MSEKILKIEDILKSSGSSEPKKKAAKVKKKPKKNIPRGTPKSGRVWKSQKTRFSSIVKSRGLKKSKSFDKQQVFKEYLARVRTLSKELEQKHKQRIEQRKQRRRKNLERKKENSLKSEVVQVITNTAKLKRIRKKQLRNVQKRDTLNKT